LKICEEQRIARWHAYAALCAEGWALSVSGDSEKGLAQIGQGVDSHGTEAPPHILLALQADAQLAIGKPEAALASVAAGLKAVEKMGGAPLEAGFRWIDNVRFWSRSRQEDIIQCKYEFVTTLNDAAGR
jgi:hypothetical protein